MSDTIPVGDDGVLRENFFLRRRKNSTGKRLSERVTPADSYKGTVFVPCLQSIQNSGIETVHWCITDVTELNKQFSLFRTHILLC